MKRQVVDSKIIDSAGYDPLLGQVELEFKGSHGVSTVRGVTQDEWNEFLASPSKGLHWNRIWKRSKESSYEKPKQ
jgi:hypothetical protein